MKVKTFSPYVIALLVGAALGYCFNGGSDSKSSETIANAEVKGDNSRRQDDGESSSNKALRARIHELEEKIAELSSVNGDNMMNEPPEGEKDNHGADGGKPRSPKEWLAELKKNDPERYAKITNHMAHFRARRIDRAQSKLDFFASIDTSGMSKESRAAIESYQDLIVKREDVEAKMHDENLSDEERANVMKEMWETDREMRDMKGSIRDSLVREVARELGREDIADDIASTINDIVDATSNEMGPPEGGGPGGRGPGGNRRGGGRGNR